MMNRLTGGTISQLPIFVAGDILHRWNEPVELVNMLITEMPHVYAVAGNHDLPSHSRDQIKRSAYWTLFEAGKITDISMGAKTLGRLQAHGFGCGVKVRPRKEDQPGLGLAIIHAYCYERDKHPGAKPEEHWALWNQRTRGYHVAHFGDNHSPLHIHDDSKTIYGAGAFICRRADERYHKPRVGILHADGSVTEKFLDVSKDKWVDAFTDVGRNELDDPIGQEFADALLDVANVTDNFADAVREYIRKHGRENITHGTRRLLVRIMENCRDE